MITSNNSSDNINRTKTVIIGSISMIGSRAIGVITNLFITTIIARTLSEESFGLWSIVISFVLYTGGMDFGFGQSLKNKLSELDAEPKDNKEAERIQYISIFWFLLLIAMVEVFTTLLLSGHLKWEKFFNIQDVNLIGLVNPLMNIVLCMLFIYVPLSLCNYCFLAYQETHKRSILDSLQSVILLIAILIGSRFFFINGMLISYYMIYLIIALLSTVIFIKHRKWSFDLPKVKDLWKSVSNQSIVSMQFWLLSISTTIIFSTDTFLVSKVSGLSEAGVFSLIQRIFGLLITAHFAVLNPLWSAYTQAAKSNDWIWLRKSFKNSVVLTLLLFILGGGIFIVLHKLIFFFWVGKRISNYSLSITIALWALLYAWINCYSVLLNSMNLIKKQTVVLIISALINIPLSIFLGHIYGAVGISLGSIISIIPIAISNTIQVSNLFKKMNFK